MLEAAAAAQVCDAGEFKAIVAAAAVAALIDLCAD